MWDGRGHSPRPGGVGAEGGGTGSVCSGASPGASSESVPSAETSAACRRGDGLCEGQPAVILPHLQRGVGLSPG